MTTAFGRLLAHPEFREGVNWQRTQYVATETIISEGDRCNEVYLVLAGRVRVLGSVSLDERRTVRPGVSELGQGDVFGELAVFDQQPRSASVVAVSDCEVAVLDGAALLAFLDAHPDIGYPLLKELVGTLVGRLRKANLKLFSLFAWGLKAHHIDVHL